LNPGDSANPDTAIKSLLFFEKVSAVMRHDGYHNFNAMGFNARICAAITVQEFKAYSPLKKQT